MSSLRDRLHRFKKPEADKQAPPPTAEAGAEWARLGAQVHTSEAGAFLLRRRAYPASSRHGRYRLAELADAAQELACFHGVGSVRADELLFFDTETTGLGVGAGNVPFLVGIGYYSGGSQFIVEQLFIRNPGEELAMLAYFQELAGRFTHVVSYNGRTFDWPILKNRYVLNRLTLDDSRLHQLDLLYPSRSLWRHSLPSCRLSRVEEERLGFERVNDVSGALAPTYYFQYLADKDPSVLEGVFTHNEHDVVSLAALSIHFARLLGGAAAAEIEREKTDGEERFRTGLWLEKMGKRELARLYLDALFERLLTASDEAELLLQLASYYKKQGCYDRAVKLWEKLAAVRVDTLAPRLEPYLELAMYYEHKEKNYRQALYYTEEARSKLWRRRSLQRLDSRQSELEEALQRRRDRLNGKLEKQAQSHAPRQADTSAPAQRKPRRPRISKPHYVRESLL